MSCKEYAVLHLDWMAILVLRFGGYLVPIEFVDFDVVSEHLGICYSLSQVIRWYFGLPMSLKSTWTG